jgi:electron transfer flavoprotein alpha subunit
MSILVIAEHNNSNLKTFTLNTITAASKIDQDIHILVAGNKCESVAKEVAAIPLVKKVLYSDSLNYANFLPENLTPLIVKVSDTYTHIIASANTFGKNFMPRVSALLDSSQISDVIKINSSEEFLRPIYAGNAFATVKSNDKKKCIKIRPTSF